MIPVLTANQLRAADELTCQTQHISSLELMEHAARAVTDALLAFLVTAPHLRRVVVCCGPGNNGGDGLAVARLLHEAGTALAIEVCYLTADQPSPDWLANRARLPEAIPARVLEATVDFPPLDATTLVVDALFGTGLNRPLTYEAQALVEYLNAGPAPIVAIDVPSGLLTDGPTPPDWAVVRATRTLTLGALKLPFLLPATAGFVGEWDVLDLNLDLPASEPRQHLTQPADLQHLLGPRQKFGHKGAYGHALLLAGSRGKLGAAVLAARACLRAGVGLLTVQVPACGYATLQTTVPEAMTLTDPMSDYLTTLADTDGLTRYRALGIGPGLGQQAETATLLRELLTEARQGDVATVLDADALNILSQHPHWLHHLPARTVLTPHPKEFERLTGPATDDFHRLELLRRFCAAYGCTVILKGAHSVVCDGDGMLYFNPTGNPGMATGGTGDVLTGIVLGLLAEGLPPLDAARLGALVHGRAGDLARDQHGERGLTAGDVVEHLGRAFGSLRAGGE